MARSSTPLVGGTKPQHRPVHYTLLDTWLHAHDISKAGFSRMVGADEKSVKFWCWGQVLPDLVFAYLIDKATAGGVPVSSWMGTEIAKLVWRARLRDSPERMVISDG